MGCAGLPCNCDKGQTRDSREGQILVFEVEREGEAGGEKEKKGRCTAGGEERWGL